MIRALVAAVALMLPGAAVAQCEVRADFGGISDLEMLQVLRCLNNEVVKLRRDQTRLEQRLQEYDRLLSQMPAEYSNADGQVTEEPGRAIGRASFVLTARATGSASALQIEQRVLEEVCGKSGGCALSLTFRQFSMFDGAAKGTVLIGPCQFSYDAATGAWGVGDACSGGGATSGVDGDQRGVGGDAGDVIAQSGGACVLSESDLARASGVDAIARDGSRGLFLLSIPSRQADGIRRFNCELVLD